MTAIASQNIIEWSIEAALDRSIRCYSRELRTFAALHESGCAYCAASVEEFVSRFPRSCRLSPTTFYVYIKTSPPPALPSVSLLQRCRTSVSAIFLTIPTDVSLVLFAARLLAIPVESYFANAQYRRLRFELVSSSSLRLWSFVPREDSFFWERNKRKFSTSYLFTDNPGAVPPFSWSAQSESERKRRS